MEDLKGKLVLLTGAARGMGKVHAMNFAREGCRVIITDVDSTELERTAGELESKGCEVFHYLLDVSNREACFELAEKVESEVGPLDILVNNAGIVENYAVLELSERSLRRMMEVNYFGQIWMMHAFVPRMVKRGRGHVVNVCSVAGKVGNPLMGGYCASKHAAIAITDTIRQEVHGTGVNFTIVNPAYVKTGMFEGAKLPFITSWLTSEQVSDALMQGLKKNKVEVNVPLVAVWGMGFARGLHAGIIDLLFRLFKQEKSMAGWKKDESRPF